MKKWEIINNVKDQSDKFNVDKIVEILLKNRGIEAEKDREAFLYPKLENVTIESVGIDKKQLKKTIKRLQEAIDEKEQIIVFGDYDVDGITGTAILWETLHDLEARVMPYIPHRIDEGYGLSIKGIEHVLEQYPDTKIIITVDNGIVANKAVSFAKEKNIQVIVTDHHVPHDEKTGHLPDAFAIVHTTKLCGAGVAYLLSQHLKNNKDGEDDHLELAALGTIADLVPLTGANRAIAKFGLEKLCRTKRYGLQALYEQAAISTEAIGVYEVGHMIAPRLNAAGRLESAMDSLRLLCTTDVSRAVMLAQQLGQVNKERQFLMQEAAQHAITHVKSQNAKVKSLLMVAHEDYQQGVIGLVAGKLVEEFYRPAIVISKGEKLSKASVRSISGFNIIEFLRSASEHLVDVGGHPMAAGFTVETAKIEILQKTLEEMADRILDESSFQRVLKIDCELPLAVITNEFYHDIKQLAPFGMGNPEPTFVSYGVEIVDMRIIGREGTHLKMRLKQKDSDIFDAIAFGMAEKAADVHIGDLVDIVYTVDENTWNGNTKLQLKIKDIKTISPASR